MKTINQSRINHVRKYIEDYYRAHNEYPTFRQIKEDCLYSSLSLVYSDIAKLKEQGILLSGKHSHVRLASHKENIRYDYPFIIMTDALYNLDSLNGEEKMLLESQDNYLKGNYSLANKQADALLETSNDQSVRFGAALTKCLCATFFGDEKPLRNFSRLLVTYQPKTLSEKMEKELLAHFISNSLGDIENIPVWLKEGRFYGLRHKAMPLAKLAFLSNAVSDDHPISPSYLEPLCSESTLEKIDICQIYMDLYLAMSYHYIEDDKYLKEHLMGAVKTCLKRNWITPLAEMKKSLGTVLDPILSLYGNELVKKVDSLQRELSKGFDKIYQLVVGENPAKGLTFREIEIINYIRLDYSTKEIANKLYLSAETVKYYISSIFLKVGVSNRHELKELIKKTIAK